MQTFRTRTSPGPGSGTSTLEMRNHRGSVPPEDAWRDELRDFALAYEFD